MTTAAVGDLYDALQEFEGRRRGDGAYPVHKQIAISGIRQQDIYDWIADRLELRSTDRVLDVGCGVGFGTIRLAERGVARATGLTISRRELERATLAASRSRHANALDFLEGSFDRLPRGRFDVIVAVESLKHSEDLARTLDGLREALAPGGRLVVVEDVFDGDASSASARVVVKDWLLKALYRQADYIEAMSPAVCHAVDLTAGVRHSGPLALAAKLAGLAVALPYHGASRATALRALRGGLHHERLYATGDMRYLAMFW